MCCSVRTPPRPRPARPLVALTIRWCGAVDSWVLHRADSNFQAHSAVGLVNVYNRPDCRPLIPSGDVHVAAATSAWPLGPAVLRGGQVVEAADPGLLDTSPTAASVGIPNKSKL